MAKATAITLTVYGCSPELVETAETTCERVIRESSLQVPENGICTGHVSTAREEQPGIVVLIALVHPDEELPANLADTFFGIFSRLASTLKECTGKPVTIRWQIGTRERHFSTMENLSRSA